MHLKYTRSDTKRKRRGLGSLKGKNQSNYIIRQQKMLDSLIHTSAGLIRPVAARPNIQQR